MAVNPNDVIRWLDRSELSEGELVADPELGQMLDPFRAHPPLPYRCSKGRCRQVIAFWALASHGSRVIPAPQRRPAQHRIAGTYPADEPEHWQKADPVPRLVGGEADLLYPGLEHTGRFPEYVEWAMRPDSTFHLITNPEVGAPYPLRIRFTCPNPACDAVYRHTNRSMLRLLFRAVALGQREVRPTRI